MSREVNEAEFIDLMLGLALADEGEARQLNQALWQELTTKEIGNAAENLRRIFGPDFFHV